MAIRWSANPLYKLQKIKSLLMEEREKNSRKTEGLEDMGAVKPKDLLIAASPTSTRATSRWNCPSRILPSHHHFMCLSSGLAPHLEAQHAWVCAIILRLEIISQLRDPPSSRDNLASRRQSFFGIQLDCTI